MIGKAWRTRCHVAVDGFDRIIDVLVFGAGMTRKRFGGF
jgi:hypothetical protein